MQILRKKFGILAFLGHANQINEVPTLKKEQITIACNVAKVKYQANCLPMITGPERKK